MGGRRANAQLKDVEHMIPDFVTNLNTWSPIMAAKKAGFIWYDYRQIVLQIPEVRKAYNKYIDNSIYTRNGLTGGL